MLLTYLYTLEVPNFYLANIFNDAENAYLIGDKYQLPALKAAGQAYMVTSFEQSLQARKFPVDSTVVRRWCRFIERF